MAPFKIMISAVALAAFTATGASAQDHHRARTNQGERAPRAEQARPREQAQPRQQAEPRQAQPREQVQPRREQMQPRTFEQRAPQVQGRTYAPRAEQAQPRTFERRDNRPMQVRPPVDVRPNNQVRPDDRRYSGERDRNFYGDRDRAVPRTYETPRPYRNDSRGYYGGRTYRYVSPRIIRPIFGAWVPYRPYVYRPSLRIGVYYGYDGYYPYGYTPDYYFNPIPGHLYGGLRIVNAPRDAQVFADGYYVGIVNDFDGVFQHLNLEAGPHHIEINEPGLEPVAFDVDIAPGRTITFRADPYMFE